MRPGIGGHEMLNLYAEAIERMTENRGIPPLFRSIFNNAYLPYRDPRNAPRVPQDHRRVQLRRLRAAGRRLRVPAVRSRLPGRRRTVPHSAPHHRLHRLGRRPEESMRSFSTQPAEPPDSSSHLTSTSSTPIKTPTATARSRPTTWGGSPPTSRATTSLRTWCACRWSTCTCTNWWTRTSSSTIQLSRARIDGTSTPM